LKSGDIYRRDTLAGLDQALSSEDRLMLANRVERRVTVARDKRERLTLDVWCRLTMPNEQNLACTLRRSESGLAELTSLSHLTKLPNQTFVGNFLRNGSPKITYKRLVE
jgi:hypothetical protein